jgi:hypothetical protein
MSILSLVLLLGVVFCVSAVVGYVVSRWVS